MEPVDFIPQLCQLFGQADCPVIFSALRQDPFVWETIQQPDVADDILKRAGNNLRAWSPAALFLYQLNSPESTDDLIKECLHLEPTLYPLASELRQKSALEYERTYQNNQAPDGLEQAGLLALALRERRRLKGSWQGLAAELAPKNDEDARLFYEIWRSPLAILFSMIPDPTALLSAILPEQDQDLKAGAIALVYHAVLSNPLPPGEQVALLSRLMARYTPSSQLKWLSRLDDMGRPELLRELAQALLNQPETAFHFAELKLGMDNGDHQPGNSSRDLAPGGSSDPLLTHESLGLIESTRQFAAFYEYAGDHAHSATLLEDAARMAARLQARIASQLAVSIQADPQENEQYQNALQQAHQLFPDSRLAQSNLAACYLQAGREDEASSALPEGQDPDPIIQLLQARLTAIQGNLPQAQEKARQSLPVLLSPVLPPLHEGLLRKSHIHPDQSEIIKTLAALNLYDEAARLTDHFLAENPLDLELMDLASQVYHQAGRLPQAIQIIQSSIALQPGQIGRHRKLASLLEEAQLWERALVARQDIMGMAETPSRDDTLALAKVGLTLKKQEIVLPICQALLTENPDDGDGHYLAGEALLLTGDQQGAIDHFTQATLLIPEQPQSWLALSNALSISGESQKSLENLRAAALSCPQSAEIMAALGQACLANGSPSEALPALRTAFALDQHSLPVVLVLSDTLLHLGHYGEAREVVESAIPGFPGDPQLAYTYARCLLACREKSLALPYLLTAATAITGQTQPAELLGETVMSLLSESRSLDTCLTGQSAARVHIDLDTTTACLAQAAELEPENTPIQLLLAETLNANGKAQEANQIFRTLAESDRSKEPAYYWRTQHGLGLTAKALGQIDTALAALQEAASAKPETSEIQRDLAEAFLQAGLVREASQTAQMVIKDTPGDLPNLVWFGRFMVELKDLPEATRAFEKAVSLAPERSDLVLMLGQTHFEAGDPIAAQNAFNQLPSLPGVSPQELQLASRYFAKMGEIDQAIAYLEAARQKQPEPAFDLLLELANAYDQSGNQKAALEAVEQAVPLQPDDIPLLQLQASLYEKLDNRQPALGCFERLLGLIDAKSSQADSRQSADIHNRMAKLLRAEGNLASALNHAEEAVHLAPDAPGYRSLAAHLSYALMDFNNAAQWSLLPDKGEAMSQNGQADPGHGDLAVTRLLCLQGELALARGDYSQARAAITRAAQSQPDHPRVLALMARQEEQKGETRQAEVFFNSAFVNLSQSHLLDRAEASYQPAATRDSDTTWDILSIAEAALDLGKWSVALSLFQRCIEKAPHDAFPRLRYARALVLCAETQWTFQALKIKTHAPGEDMLDAHHYDLFEEAYLSANRLSQSTEIIHWHNRGQAVFRAGLQTAKSLGNYILGPDDTAALIAAYSRVKMISEAQKAAQAFINNPEVLLQLNLALRDTDLDTSLAAIQAAIEMDPHNPVLQAAYAFANAHEEILARQAIEAALSTWPDEPEWHQFAAELCQSAEDTPAAIAHWQMAVQIDPGSYEFTFALGSEYLADNRYPDAIHTLDQAIHINPFQAEAWYALAKANLLSGNYNEALSCAEQTCDLAPNQIDPLLLTGEIALQLGQHQKAISKAQAILNLIPQNTKAILLNSRALNAMGKSQAALEMIDLNLASSAQPIPLLTERAQLIRQIQGIQTALPVLQELAQKYPNEPEVLRLLAGALDETGQTDAAERTAQTSLKLLPDQPSLHLLLGRIQRAKGQLDQAISHLSEAIRLDPTQLEAYLELGQAYHDRRDHLQALKVYRQATQMAPNDPRAYYNAALALKESKDYLAAETMLRHAARLSPDDVNIRRQLGAIITLNLVHHPQEASVTS